MEQEFKSVDNLNAQIDIIKNHEDACDEVLTVLYNKFQRLPRRSEIIREYEFLNAKDNLLKSDEMFKNLLFDSINWLKKIGLKTYLDLWTFENHIPYKEVL
jgi:hypothetical protein